jgi:hypothetical protein
MNTRDSQIKLPQSLDSTIKQLGKSYYTSQNDPYKAAFELSVVEMDIVYPQVSHYFDSLPPLHNK